MPDYVEEINMKEIGIVSLKVKIKEVETILFDEEVVDDFENSQDIKLEIEEFRNEQLKRLTEKYKDSIPEEEIEKLNRAIGNMEVFWESKSTLDESILDSLSQRVLDITDNNSQQENLFERVFKEMLFLYIKEKNKNIKQEPCKTEENKDLKAFDHLKLFFSKLFKG